MTLSDFLVQSYSWADQNAVMLLAVSLALPIVGTLLAWIGRGGRTDADGRFIANLVVGLALIAIVVEAAGLVIGSSVFGKSALDANVMVVAAPVIAFAGSVLGIRMVFPLNELASVRTIADVGAFVIASALVLWLFSKFHGWGVMFIGSFLQLMVVAVLGWFFLRRLYRRAFGLDAARDSRPRSSAQRVAQRRAS
jgi:hypothetical protein